jgi:hypothetical protein
MSGLGSLAQKVDANAALRNAFGRQEAGTRVDPRDGRVASGSCADDWVAGRHDLAMRTRQDHDDLLRLHLKPVFESTPIADISAVSVRRWWAKAGGTDGHGRAPKTYLLLRTILNTAVEDGLIPRNPCRIKNAGSDKTPERPTVTVEQVYASPMPSHPVTGPWSSSRRSPDSGSASCGLCAASGSTCKARQWPWPRGTATCNETAMEPGTSPGPRAGPACERSPSRAR